MHPVLTIAKRAALGASRILLRHFDQLERLTVTEKRPSDFVSEADVQAEQDIIQILRKTYPDHGILAEEGNRIPDKDFEWIIDPLDGTTNFIHGMPQLCVSIGIKHFDRLEHAVIYNPIHDELFTATRGGGAHLNDRRLRIAQRKDLDGALLGTGFPFRDFSYLDTYLATFKAFMLKTAGIRRPGSAALDLAYVAAGRYDGFWEFNLKPWDLAAGALLVQEAGGVATDFTGDQGFLENGNIVAGNLRVHAQMLHIISQEINKPKA